MTSSAAWRAGLTDFRPEPAPSTPKNVPTAEPTRPRASAASDSVSGGIASSTSVLNTRTIPAVLASRTSTCVRLTRSSRLIPVPVSVPATENLPSMSGESSGLAAGKKVPTSTGSRDAVAWRR